MCDKKPLCAPECVAYERKRNINVQTSLCMFLCVCVRVCVSSLSPYYSVNSLRTTVQPFYLTDCSTRTKKKSSWFYSTVGFIKPGSLLSAHLRTHSVQMYLFDSSLLMFNEKKTRLKDLNKDIRKF